MKITLISFDNWGFNNHIYLALKKDGHTVHHIDFSKFKYQYPSTIHRTYNFLLKTFFNQNLKTKFFGKKIIEELEKLESTQDVILTIKADFIAPEFALEIKKYTKKSIAFFNDNIKRCPKILRVIHCFDDVYSFEKTDCENHNLKHKTNFIYNYIPSRETAKNYKFKVFNISSFGKRSHLVVKIAEILNKNEISNKIIILDKKNKLKETNAIEIIKIPKSLDEINELMEISDTLLDIHRENQTGLSFRVFESLGLHKKLITTNDNIRNYDFFNPTNILIIDVKKPKIPIGFFLSNYKTIPQPIIDKYKTLGWFSEFLK